MYVCIYIYVTMFKKNITIRFDVSKSGFGFWLNPMFPLLTYLRAGLIVWLSQCAAFNLHWVEESNDLFGRSGTKYGV